MYNVYSHTQTHTRIHRARQREICKLGDCLVHVQTFVGKSSIYTEVYVSQNTQVSVCVFVYVCVCVYIYIYIYIHTYTL